MIVDYVPFHQLKKGARLVCCHSSGEQVVTRVRVGSNQRHQRCLSPPQRFAAALTVSGTHHAQIGTVWRKRVSSDIWWGVAKLICSVSLFSLFFGIMKSEMWLINRSVMWLIMKQCCMFCYVFMKTHDTHSYLTDVTTAKLRRHLSNMNMISKFKHIIL